MLSQKWTLGPYTLAIFKLFGFGFGFFLSDGAYGPGPECTRVFRGTFQKSTNISILIVYNRGEGRGKESLRKNLWGRQPSPLYTMLREAAKKFHPQMENYKDSNSKVFKTFTVQELSAHCASYNEIPSRSSSHGA